MMKKMISCATAMLMLFSTVISAYAAEPDFLNTLYTNYTGEYSISVSFESGEEIAALLDEMELSEELSMFADVKDLLKTLLTLDTKMTLQADMSKDMKKAEISVVSSSEQRIDVNKNLNIELNMQTGMWIRMDISAKTPVFEVIYSYPMLAKYMRIDLFALLSDEEKEEMLATFDLVFSKQFMQETQDFSAELMKKYAQIYRTGELWVIELDNDAVCKMLNELLPYTAEKIGLLMDKISGTSSSEDISGIAAQIPSFDGLKLLGDEGISCTYSMSGGRISSARMVADVEIDISEIFTSLVGEEWIYESAGVLDFDVTASVKLSKVGTTSVDFPTLTEENSFDAADAVETTQPEEYIEETSEYPHTYIDVYTDKVYMINGELFVPLRQTIFTAYEDMCKIEYDRGKIILTSEYFPQFKEILLTAGSDKAYAGGVEFNIGKVFVEAGKAYASVSFFEDVLGWEMSGAIYDVFAREYNYTFYSW